MSISFDRAANYYDETRGYTPEVSAAIGEAIASRVGATEGTRFLEVGVGTGRIALPLALLGYEVTGVDISQSMMARLRDKLREYAQAGRSLQVQLVEADMQSLPFGNAEFDAVIAAHVFHLVSDPRRAAQEALRVLRPHGSLLVCGDMVAGHEELSVSEKWREIVQRRRQVLSSAEAADRVLRDLVASEPGLAIEESSVASWRFSTSVADELDSIRRRLWSNTWVLPDHIYEECFRELEAWCLSTFAGKESEPLPRTSEFHIRRVWRAP
jgi:ubiquinone/menaquinone biosynthesis C-methylase UbiE